MRQRFEVIRRTLAEFIDEDPFTHAGALSYSSLLSFGPLLLMVVSVAGLVYGEEAARGEVLAQLQTAIGRPAAELAQQALAHAHEHGAGGLSATIAVIAVIVGSTTALAQLQTALDKIWGVKPPKQAWFAVVRARLMSLLFIMLLGTAVIASLITSSVISALSNYTVAGLDVIWRLADIGVPLALMTVLFAMLFKLLPSAEVRWRDVWIGAAITSLLFTLGRLVIGFYVGHAGLTAYGAAGSVIGLLVWVYYSAVIVLFGAELTQVVARWDGSDVKQRKFGLDA